MSWKAVEWAKTWNGELTTAEAFVLFLIAEHYNEGVRRAWPSATTLCDLTRMGRSTVFRAIRSLEAKGLVETESWANPRGRKLTNRYCLPMYDSRSTPRGGVRRVKQGFGSDGSWSSEDVEAEPDGAAVDEVSAF